MIVEIGNIEIARIIDRDPARGIELPRSAAAPADRAQRRAVEREHLNAIIEIFGDIKEAVTDRQIHRPAELAQGLARGPECAPETAVAVEDLDAAVSRVRDEDLVAGDRDPGGVAELPRSAARLAPGGDEDIAGFPGRGNEEEPADEQQCEPDRGGAQSPCPEFSHLLACLSVGRFRT